MRVTVFGATGRTGRLVVAEALQRGHGVHAFVRTPGRLDPHDGLREFRGDGQDRGDVRSALEGADTVVSALGLASVERPTEHSSATRTIVEAMQEQGPPTISVILNRAVFTDEVAPEFAPFVAEHKRNLATLRGSSLSWVGLCPGFLTDDAETGGYVTTVEAAAPGRTITRADLAAALLDVLGSPTNQALGISN